MPLAPIDPRSLIDFAAAVYAGAGVPADDAFLIADSLPGAVYRTDGTIY